MNILKNVKIRSTNKSLNGAIQNIFKKLINLPIIYFYLVGGF